MQTLRLFCDVATARSFSQAAVRHGITQSAASQRVGQLEKKLGVTLLDRSVRPLVLTPAGEMFLRGCRELIERYDELERRVSRSGSPNGGRGPATGQVVVDAIYSAGIDLLNQVKDEFEATHPQITVMIEYKRPEEVYEAVREQRCDLGILSYPQRWRDVSVLALRNERMAVVCSPRHELAKRGRNTMQAAELVGFEMAAFENGLPVARRIRKYLKDHHAAVAEATHFDNIDTIKTAVGVTDTLFAILPMRTVRHEVAAGTLVAIGLEPELSRPIGIIHHKSSRRTGGAGSVTVANGFSPAAQLFVDFLIERAGDGDALPTRSDGNLVGGKHVSATTQQH